MTGFVTTNSAVNRPHRAPAGRRVHRGRRRNTGQRDRPWEGELGATRPATEEERTGDEREDGRRDHYTNTRRPASCSSAHGVSRASTKFARPAGPRRVRTSTRGVHRLLDTETDGEYEEATREARQAPAPRRPVPVMRRRWRRGRRRVGRCRTATTTSRTSGSALELLGKEPAQTG